MTEQTEPQTVKTIEAKIDALTAPFQQRKESGWKQPPFMLLYDKDITDLRGEIVQSFDHRINSASEYLDRFSNVVNSEKDESQKDGSAFARFESFTKIRDTLVEEYSTLKNIPIHNRDNAIKESKADPIAELTFMIVVAEKKTDLDAYKEVKELVAKLPDDVSQQDKTRLMHKCKELQKYLQEDAVALGKEIAASFASILSYNTNDKMIPISDYRLTDIIQRNKNRIVATTGKNTELKSKADDALNNLLLILQKLNRQNINFAQNSSTKERNALLREIEASFTTLDGKPPPEGFQLKTFTLTDQNISDEQIQFIHKAYAAHDDIKASSAFVESIPEIGDMVAAIRNLDKNKNNMHQYGEHAKDLILRLEAKENQAGTGKSTVHEENEEPTAAKEITVEKNKKLQQTIQKVLRVSIRVATETTDSDALLALRDDIYDLFAHQRSKARRNESNGSIKLPITKSLKNNICEKLFQYSGQIAQEFTKCDLIESIEKGRKKFPEDATKIYDYVTHHIYVDDKDPQELKELKRDITNFIIDIFESKKISIDKSTLDAARKRVDARPKPNEIPAEKLAELTALAKSLKKKRIRLPVDEKDIAPQANREAKVDWYLGEAFDRANKRLHELEQKKLSAKANGSAYPNTPPSIAKMKKELVDFFTDTQGNQLSLSEIAKKTGIYQTTISALLGDSKKLNPMLNETLENHYSKFSEYLKRLGKDETTIAAFKEKLFAMNEAVRQEREAIASKKKASSSDIPPPDADDTRDTPNGTANITEVRGMNKHDYPQRY